jgi:YVTN family beta-propeller protein
VAFSPDGSTAYVPNTNGRTLSVIDVVSSTVVKTVEFSTTPQSIAVSPAGDVAYIAMSSSVYGQNGSVAILSLATNTVISSIAVGLYPDSVAFTPSGDVAYVTNSGSDSVTVIDVVAGEAAELAIAVGDRPTAIEVSPNGAVAYVTNFDAKTVSVIGTSTNTVTQTITLGGSNPSGLAFTPDSSTAYVSYGGGLLAVISVNDDTVDRVLELSNGAYGMAMSPDGSTLLVTEQNDSRVAVIDVATDAISHLSTGSRPVTAAFSSDGTVAYVANYSSNSVSVIRFNPALSSTIVSRSTSAVTASVTAGTLTASITDAAFPPVPFSHQKQITSAEAVLSTDDQTGLLYGWNVTVKASALVWASPSDIQNPTRNIPAANLSLSAVNSASTVSGDDFSGTLLSSTSALDSAVSVVSTAAEQGSGSYTVPLTLNLLVPANAATGSYTGTLTTTISAAP